MRIRSADLFTGVLAVCALTSATLAVQRYTSHDGEADGPAPPTYVADWREIEGLSSVTAVRGDSSHQEALATIVEFSDFQCPYCAVAHSRLRRLQEEKPRVVRLLFRHRPLNVHPYALAAAVASECARSQGRFDEFADAAFAHQAQLGSMSWDSLAKEAGVRDLVTFAECQRSPAPLARVQADNELSKRVGVVATPGILIRDSLWLGAPTAADLHSRVARIEH
jgi:protein-disulfide isomerase